MRNLFDNICKFLTCHLLPIAGGTALLLATVLAVGNLWFGDLNQDEGWYLYAAQNISRGNMLYRDFFFTQGPVMPYLYAAAAPLWSNAGVLGGRILTTIFGFIAALMAGGLAASVLPRERRGAAFVITIALTACSVYHSYFCVIPKTYALTAFFLTGACLLLTRLHSRLAVFTAGLLFACAAATRISMGAGAIVAGIYLLFMHRRTPWQWLGFATGGVLGLAALYGPFFYFAWEQWFFANQFHAAREGGGLLFIGGSVARLIRGYFPLAAVGALFFVLRLTRTPCDDDEPKDAATFTGFFHFPGLWAGIAAAIMVLQWCSPFPYDDYQVPVMPLLAAAATVALCRSLPGGKVPAAATIIAAVAALNAVASPNIQAWFFIRQDRFWPVMKSVSDLQRLRDVGAMLAERTPPGFPILTQDTYLAVEANRTVPEGMEMGPFGYFPELDDETAIRCRVLNRGILESLLEQVPATMAAFSGYAFALAAPEMKPVPEADREVFYDIIRIRFEPFATENDFGQNHTTLTVWQSRQKGIEFLARRPVPEFDRARLVAPGR